jgi:hypothetical protein
MLLDRGQNKEPDISVLAARERVTEREIRGKLKIFDGL